jgi:colicin import membrane protein
MTMTASASIQRDAFMPRAPDAFGRGLALAVAAHLALVVALSVGVSWHVSPPEGIEAELWAAVPQMAAPRAAEPEPPPPAPEPKVEPLPEPVKAAPVVAPEPDAQIAIEKAKRKKELAKEAARQAEKEAAAREAEKLAEQKRKDEAADKRRAELDKKKRDDAQAAALAAAREKQMQRLAGLAGATGAPTATGSALQSAGPSADYLGRIKGRIRPNVSFPDTLPGNPAVEIDIRLAPDGRIVSSRIVKRSGVPEWDEAVLRAIERTEVLPRDESGKVPPAMTIVYRPRD